MSIHVVIVPVRSRMAIDGSSGAGYASRKLDTVGELHKERLLEQSQGTWRQRCRQICAASRMRGRRAVCPLTDSDSSGGDRGRRQRMLRRGASHLEEESKLTGRFEGVIRIRKGLIGEDDIATAHADSPQFRLWQQLTDDVFHAPELGLRLVHAEPSQSKVRDRRGTSENRPIGRGGWRQVTDTRHPETAARHPGSVPPNAKPGEQLLPGRSPRPPYAATRPFPAAPSGASRMLPPMSACRGPSSSCSHCRRRRFHRTSGVPLRAVNIRAARIDMNTPQACQRCIAGLETCCLNSEARSHHVQLTPPNSFSCR
jgi:hypothetical protein